MVKKHYGFTRRENGWLFMSKYYKYVLGVIFAILLCSQLYSAQIFNYPKFSSRTITGAALAGGHVHTYAPGTTTPKAAYQDKAKTTPHTNPIVLDSRGEATIYFNGSYKVVLENSAGVVQWTMDNLEGSGSSVVDFATLEDDYAGDLAAAITAIGSTPTRLVIKSASDTLAGNITIPATLELEFTSGGYISTGGYTVTINGNVYAGPFQIFSGFDASTDISFGSGSTSSVYPEWFGLSSSATGANNITYLNAAIGSVASGGKIEFASGKTYACAGQWTINKACEVWFNGSTLNFSTNSTNQGVVVTASNVRFVEPRLTGPQVASYAATQIAIRATGTDNNPSAPTYISGLKVIGGEISNWSRGMNWDFISEFEITGAYIHDVVYDGIRLGSCKYGRVHHNRIEDITGTGLSNAYGIHVTVDQGTGSTVTSDPASQDILVDGNDIYNNAIWEGLDTHGGVRVKFIGNNVYECPLGISMTSVANNVDATVEYPLTYCSAVGNTVHLTGTSTSHGMTDNGLATSTGLAVGTIIADNHIIGPFKEGIYSRYNKDSLYTGNIIQGATDYGLNVLYSINNINVSSNIIGPLAAGATAPIFFNSSSNVDSVFNSGLFSNNIINADGCNYGVYNSANTFVDYRFRSNDIKKYATDKYYYATRMNFNRLINTTPNSTSGADEDALTTLVLYEDCMSAKEVLRVHAAGTKTGTAGNKTLKLRLGSSYITFDSGASTAGDWSIDAIIVFTATNAQLVSWVGNGTSVAAGHDELTEDIAAGDLAIGIYGTCANSGDTITQTMLIIERIEE